MKILNLHFLIASMYRQDKYLLANTYICDTLNTETKLGTCMT